MRLLAPLCLGAVLLSSCTMGINTGSFPRVSVAPPPGFIYSAYKAPLMTDFDSTPASSTKRGKATTSYISVFGFSFAFDDASVEAASRDGGIAKLHYADYEITQVNIWFVAWGQYSTIAYGE